MKKVKLSHKILSSVLALLMVFTSFPIINTYAAVDENLGQVSAITKPAEINDTDQSKIVITYDEITLEWSPADKTIGRTKDGWWAGIEMTAPNFDASVLENATYESFAYGTSEPIKNKSFWENQDSKETDEQHYITLWTFVNEENLNKASSTEEGVISTSWNFDWNNDGVNEQTVTTQISPKSIILNKDGKQVYPVQPGTVTAITNEKNAVIDDKDSANIVVSYKDKLELSWSDTDKTVGRTKAGWWTGIKMTAPGLNASVLKNAKYDSLANGTTDWVVGKDFWENQDSKETDEQHYITLWTFVNEEDLNDALTLNNSIATSWRFDWNNDGIMDQTVTTQINPSEVEVILNKDNKQLYPATELGTVTGITGTPIIENDKTNSVTISYDDKVTLQWSQADAKIGRNNDGWWAGIKMTAPQDADLENAKYKSKATPESKWVEGKEFAKAKDGDNFITLWAYVANEDMLKNGINTQWGFDWDNDGVYEQYVDFKFDSTNVKLDYTNFYAMDKAAPIISGLTDSTTYKKDDVIVEFDVVDGATESNGADYTSGIYDVYFSAEKVVDKTIENISKLEKANKVDDNKYSFKVSNDTNKRYYIYAIDNSNNIADANVLVQVDKTAPVFEKNPVIDTDDWTSKNVTIKGKISDNLSGIADKSNFTISTDAKNAAFNYNFLDKNKGEYTITIPEQTFVGDLVLDCIDNAGNKSTQKFSLQMDKTNCVIMSLEVSESNWTNSDVVITGTVKDSHSGVREVTAVLDGTYEKEPIVNYNPFDEKSGEYIITVPAQNYSGKLTVNAIDNAGNDIAEKDDSVVSLSVDLKMDTTAPAVEKAMVSKIGWTKDDVIISGEVSDNLSKVSAVYYAKGDSIDGLTVSNISEKATSAIFDKDTNIYSFDISAQNYAGNYVIYAVDNAGNISIAKTVSVFMDTVAPSNLSVEFTPTAITKVLEAITFGFYNSKNADVIAKLSATDSENNNTISGVSKFEYSINDGEYVSVETTGVFELKLKGEFKDTIKFKAYDNAGNCSLEFNSKSNAGIQGAISDWTLPIVQEEIEYATPSNIHSDGKMYFDKDVTITFPIKEEHFYKEYEKDGITVSTIDENVEMTVTKDGNEINDFTLSMTSINDGDDKNTIAVTIPVKEDGISDGDYKVKLIYTDLSGNKVEKESDEFVIDTTAPEITAKYKTSVNTANGIDYYNEANPVGLEITVKEHNFDPAKFISKITAKNIAGDNLEEIEKSLVDFCSNSENWTTAEGETDTYVISVPLENADANYVVDYEFQDLALNAAAEVTSKALTYDMTNPEIEISTSVALAYKVLNAITFGFFNPDVTVTITAKDETAGIKNTVIQSKAIEVENARGEFIKEFDISEAESIEVKDGIQAVAFKYKLSAETYKNGIVAIVYDYSGNSESADNIVDENGTYNGVIVDTTDPVFTSIAYNEINSDVKGDVTKHYYSSNAKIVFTVDEEYFFENYYETAADAKANSDNSVSALKKDVTLEITKNGDEYYKGSAVASAENSKLFKSEFNEIAKTITVTILSVLDGKANDGDFIVKIGYTDLANHYGEVTTDTLVIDTTAPIVTVSYDNNTVSENALDNTYFNANRTATITVVEQNFAPEYIASKITAVDVNGKDATTKAAEILAGITNKGNWTQDEEDKNKYTYVIEYSDDANYTFEFASAKDYALNEMNPENGNRVIYADDTVSEEKFVVDKIAPSENVRYTITNQNDNSLKKVLNILTFGIFFNSKVDIIVETTDATAGLYKAILRIKDIDGNVIDNLSIDGSGIFTLKDDKSKGDTTFTVDVSKLDEFRGKLYIDIYDKAGNLYRNYQVVTDDSVEDTANEFVKVDGQITVNNKVIDNNVDVIDNIEQYESIDFHKEISSIDISYTSAVKSVVNQSSPAKNAAKSLIKEKVNSNAVTDKNMCAENVPLFNTNVPVSINVIDKSSGISSIDVWVFDANENREIATYNTVIRNDGKITSKSDKVFENVQNSEWSLEQNENGLTVSANKTITIKSNCNDIVVLVQLTDNAGNISYDYYQFGIDKTSPVLSAVFNDSSNAQNSVYYNEKRTLTLTVAERDFLNSGKSVEFTYKYQGNTEKYVISANKFRQLDSSVPVYKDNKTYSYTIDIFTKDGEYADFEFSAVDRADNKKSSNASIIRSDNNNMFRYDHIAPEITVVSDEHGQNENTKFYQDSRIITVSVKDRYATDSLNQSYIVRQIANLTGFRFTDSESGQAYHTDNRILTYVFTFQTNTSIDCNLLFNRISDLAGNVTGNVPAVANANDFVVDGKIPNSFSATIVEDNHPAVNVLNQSDYKVFVGDNITLTITCEDENLSLANISNAKLVCAALTSKGKTTEQKFDIQKISSSNRNKLTYSISNLDYDGFYDLSFTVTDDSGKISSTQNVKFAICRNGALYSKNDIETIQNHGAFNANSISEISFNQYSAESGTSATLSISSKNGSLGFKSRVLVEGEDYTITGGDTRDNDLNCYRSTYQLKPNAFMMEDGRILDGVYLITITPNNTESANGLKSEDAQSTSFEVTLDATNPVISNVGTSYKTSYGSEKTYEFSQDDKKTLFTSSIVLNFNISDTFSGINKDTLKVTWGDETAGRTTVKVNEDGTCSIELNSTDAKNGNVVNISVKDNAGNDVEYSFNLTIDNHFWIYVAIAAFILVASVVIIILVIKGKKSKKNE